MCRTAWLDDRGALLGPGFPLSLTQPFLGTEALAAGCTRRDLAHLLAAGLLRKPLRGVYAATQAPDSIRFRAMALQLVVPEHATVTDRAAGWLHGMPVLKRGAHLTAPPIEVQHSTATRCRRSEAAGHRRGLLSKDIIEVAGLRVTTALRTALDLGRRSWQYDGLAALDAALRLGVSHEAMLAEVERFKGYRGVRQLRTLLPLADPRSESPGESALRLHWHHAGLPRPEPQVWIYDDHGLAVYRLDLGDERTRYAAEYDGVENHTSDDDVEHDKERRQWIRDERAWIIDAFDKEDVYRPGTNIQDRLAAGFAAARRNVAVWRP